MWGSLECIWDFLITGVVFAILLQKWEREEERLIFWYSTMYIYLCGVVYFTLMPVYTSFYSLFDHPYYTMNIMAFKDLAILKPFAERELFLNILMTIPFGILLPILYEETYETVWGKSFGLSLGIELIQPILSDNRVSDITDLLTNTFGGIVGYILYLYCWEFIYRKLKRWGRMIGISL